MLILVALWVVFWFAFAVMSNSTVGLAVGLIVAFGGPRLLDVAIARGSRRDDLLGRWCRRQERLYGRLGQRWRRRPPWRLMRASARRRP